MKIILSVLMFSSLSLYAISTENISEINLNLKGESTIKFKSGNSFEITGFTYKDCDRYPISIAVNGNKLSLSQYSGKWPFSKSTKTEFELTLPSDKVVNILCDKCMFSGDIKAKALVLDAGFLKLDSTISVDNNANVDAGMGVFDAYFQKGSSVSLTGGNYVGNIKIKDGISAKSRIGNQGALRLIYVQ